MLRFIKYAVAAFLLYSPIVADSINFTKSWGMYGVGSPISDVKIIIDNSNGKIEKLYAYKNNTWSVYYPAKSIATLTSLSQQEGFWAFANDDVTVELGISFAKSSSLTVTKGWKMYGLSEGIEDVDTVFKSHGDSVEKIYVYSKSGWKTYAPGGQSNTLAKIDPAVGFWLKAAKNDTIALSSNQNLDKPVAYDATLTTNLEIPYIDIQLRAEDDNGDKLTYELLSENQGDGYDYAYVDSDTGYFFLILNSDAKDSLELTYRVSDGTTFSNSPQSK